MKAQLSAVIPTYGRDDVLLDTIGYLGNLDPAPAEILIIDQTSRHSPSTAQTLEILSASGRIRWIRLDRPSIPHAMNVGLLRARAPVVLFLDDDIVPGSQLIRAHTRAHEQSAVVVGQVLQPGEEPTTTATSSFHFYSDRPQWITDLMAGNFSIRRELALDLGGFDENFVRAAYRFETEFAERIRSSGKKILFEPRASIRHLRASRGGTRAYGHHLRTARPGHAVGAYYHVLRSRDGGSRLAGIAHRFVSSIRTRHHLVRPWWIPATIAAEILGFFWGLRLFLRGPRLLPVWQKRGDL